jgi:iron complex transport system ATP-binding protein
MILEVRGVEFAYRSSDVLRDITFDIKENEIIAILGPNGVGKTTLLKCMNAILTPTAGAVFVQCENLFELDRTEIARRIGYVPQRCETNRMTVFDAILLGRKPHITWNVTEKDLKTVEAAIRRLDLAHLSIRYIDEMSGGELQKVSIARAIVQEPGILLLDEPTASLDLKNQVEILKLIGSITREHSVSAIITMHDLNLALRHANRFVLMKDGAIFAAGGDEIINETSIEAVYGLPVTVERHNGWKFVLPE